MNNITHLRLASPLVVLVPDAVGGTVQIWAVPPGKQTGTVRIANEGTVKNLALSSTRGILIASTDDQTTILVTGPTSDDPPP